MPNLNKCAYLSKDKLSMCVLDVSGLQWIVAHAKVHWRHGCHYAPSVTASSDGYPITSHHTLFSKKQSGIKAPICQSLPVLKSWACSELSVLRVVGVRFSVCHCCSMLVVNAFPFFSLFVRFCFLFFCGLPGCWGLWEALALSAACGLNVAIL